MGVVVSVKPEEEYLLITVSGIIKNEEEHRSLTKRLYLEIKGHSPSNIIIDETSFPHSFEFLNDIVRFYSEELPEEVKYWKIKVIDESSYLELGRYWQFIANQQGFMNYEVFSSMREAQTSLNDRGNMGTLLPGLG